MLRQLLPGDPDGRRPDKIEVLDRGRRGIHERGLAHVLQAGGLKVKVRIDFETSAPAVSRLISLFCNWKARAWPPESVHRVFFR